MLDGLGRPWAAFGPVWVGDEQLKNNVSPEASLKNRTSLPQPSAAFGPHRRPVGGCEGPVRVSPLKLPPTFYSSNMQG